MHLRRLFPLLLLLGCAGITRAHAQLADGEHRVVLDGVERIVPLGFSFGGELALEYALAHPERVERPILEDPSTGDWSRMKRLHIEGFLAVARGATFDTVAAIAADTALPLDARWNRVWSAVDHETVNRLLFVDASHAAINDSLQRASGLRNTGAMFRALLRRPAPAVPLEVRARANRVPTLVTVGLWDRNVGVDPVKNLAATMPRATLRVFPHSAHFPDIEETAAVAQAVRDFLATPAGRRP